MLFDGPIDLIFKYLFKYNLMFSFFSKSCILRPLKKNYK